MIFTELWATSACLLDEASQPPIPDDYIKSGSREAFRQNIRYFRKKKGMPITQAVAAAISVLKRHGGSYPP